MDDPPNPDLQVPEKLRRLGHRTAQQTGWKPGYPQPLFDAAAPAVLDETFAFRARTLDPESAELWQALTALENGGHAGPGLGTRELFKLEAIVLLRELVELTRKLAERPCPHCGPAAPPPASGDGAGS